MVNRAQRLVDQPADFVTSAKPFIKWVGGKRQLLGELEKRVPANFNRYVEPFVGGGALFFRLQPQRALLADSNRELIDTYKVVQNQVDELVSRLGRYIYDREQYYIVRAQRPKTLDPVGRAARMIYLNKTGYNGLYRVNSKGDFNVPFGRHTNPCICNEPLLRAASAALDGVDLHCGSFETVAKSCGNGDFVYMDPPYIPLSKTGFTAYQKSGFGMDNQERLAAVFDELSRGGVKVMLSNSDVPWIWERYSAYSISQVQVDRMVNARVSGRGKVGEVIITNY